MATSARSGGQTPIDVTKALKGIDFPASKQDLVQQARQLHAEQKVIEEIQRLDDREFQSMADLTKAFSHQGEGSSRSAGQKGQVGTEKDLKSQSKQSTHHR
jgi:hypothetical protein